MNKPISSLIDPIENLRKRIQEKRDEAFAEAAYGSRIHNFQSQAMVNAYDVVLKLIDEGEE